ncbi:MAG: hypothetical protein WCG85_21090 [Polyangia bacterium]
MKRPAFSLRSVVTFHELCRLRARGHLAAAIQTCEKAEMALADARARQDLLVDLARSDRVFTLCASEHAAFLNALRSAAEDESAAGHAVDQAHAARDRWLSEYFDALRALRFLDKLGPCFWAAHRLVGGWDKQTPHNERAPAGAARCARFLS